MVLMNLSVVNSKPYFNGSISPSDKSCNILLNCRYNFPIADIHDNDGDTLVYQLFVRVGDKLILYQQKMLWMFFNGETF